MVLLTETWMREEHTLFQEEVQTQDLLLEHLQPEQFTIPLGMSGDKWNLFGNPYPCAIDMHKFFTANASVITGTSYHYIENGNTGDYGTYTSSGNATGVNGYTPGQYLPSGQGVFFGRKNWRKFRKPDLYRRYESKRKQFQFYEKQITQALYNVPG